MRSREEWEAWYDRPDPWEYEGSDEDRLRTEAVLARLRGRRFKHALDVGCGEGRLTHAVSAFADHMAGYDIAEKALERARRRFPGIEFRQGDLLNVIRRPEVTGVPFDLILAAEVLYYLPSDEERLEAVAGLSELGAPSCLYFFSVIVTGSSPGRRYFTHDEFTRMLSERFQIVDHFPCAVDLPRAADHALRVLPFRRARMWWRKMLIGSSDPSRWRHVGYFAMKRGAPDAQSSR